MRFFRLPWEAFRHLFGYLCPPRHVVRVRRRTIIPEKSLCLDGKTYELAEVVGRGTFGLVRKCVTLGDKKEYAIKKVSLNDENRQQATRFFRNERNILERLQGHCNILEYHLFCETSKYALLLLGYASGGNLFNVITRTGPIPEAVARNIFVQMVNGVVWMHQQHVVHRDLKPENILLTSKNLSEAVVKICDFGLSKLLPEEFDNGHVETASYKAMMTTACGSRFYAAPEVIERKRYSKAIDSWGVGIILFAMLCGELPFDNVDDLKAVDFHKKLSLPAW